MAQFPLKNGLIQGTLDGTPTSGTLNLGAMTRVIMPVDQNIVVLEEDFIGGTNADGQIGMLGWRQSNISGSGSFAYVAPSTFNNPGQYQTQCAAASGNASSLYIGGSGLASLATTDGTNPLVFELRITFKLNQTTLTRFRLGIANDYSAVSPGRGEYLRYDTSNSDTNFMAVVKDGGAETATSLGVAADTNWHTLRICNTGTNNQFKFSMNTSGGSFGNEVTLTNTSVGVTRYITGIIGNDATAAAKGFILDSVKFRAIVAR